MNIHSLLNIINNSAYWICDICKTKASLNQDVTIGSSSPCNVKCKDSLCNKKCQVSAEGVVNNSGYDCSAQKFVGISGFCRPKPQQRELILGGAQKRSWVEPERAFGTPKSKINECSRVFDLSLF